MIVENHDPSHVGNPASREGSKFFGPEEAKIRSAQSLVELYAIFQSFINRGEITMYGDKTLKVSEVQTRLHLIVEQMKDIGRAFPMGQTTLNSLIESLPDSGGIQRLAEAELRLIYDGVAYLRQPLRNFPTIIKTFEELATIKDYKIIDKTGEVFIPSAVADSIRQALKSNTWFQYNQRMSGVPDIFDLRHTIDMQMKIRLTLFNLFRRRLKELWVGVKVVLRNTLKNRRF